MLTRASFRETGSGIPVLTRIEFLREHVPLEEDAVFDAEPVLLHPGVNVSPVQDIIEKYQGVAERQGWRPELVFAKAPTESRIIQFREVEKGSLAAADELQTGGVCAAML
jgi:hypothetical protein